MYFCNKIQKFISRSPPVFKTLDPCIESKVAWLPRTVLKTWSKTPKRSGALDAPRYKEILWENRLYDLGAELTC